MPLYEYICHEDQTVLELIRPMAQADEPVPDPDGKGRVFVRKLSTFVSKGDLPTRSAAVPLGTCCPCGKSAGACSRP